jgi:hypothetical protein
MASTGFNKWLSDELLNNALFSHPRAPAKFDTTIRPHRLAMQPLVRPQNVIRSVPLPSQETSE